MRRSKIKLSLIVIITILILLSCKSLFTHTNITNQNILSSSSFPEIVFNYNSTYTKQTFTVELQLELDSFNILTMFFLTSGYKTNSEGIKVTFIIEQTEIIFTIERLFQDSLSHNLTQLFSFPEAFVGKKNITVICEAQTSYFYQSGTLQITAQTTIEKILPQILTETPSSLPIFPDWIRFKGSTVSTIRKSVTTVFNNSHDFDKLNFSLSFLTNNFSAYKQYFEIEINNLIVNTRNFEENQQISESFLSDINSGINLLKIYFSVEMCIDEIQLSNIRLTINGINNQNILPDNVFDWYEWENNDFEYSFDLSALKPQVSYQEKIVEIQIDYGCIGSIVLPSISYSINDGTESVDSGDITESYQVNVPQTITTKFTSTDSNQLFTFRIQGSAVGLGYFYILNTSFITIEVLPEFQENNTLERGMQETTNYVTPLSNPLVLTFRDFFRSTLNYQKSNISLSFSLINEFGSSIRQIHVLMKFDFTIIFDKQISFEKLIELQELRTLYSQVYQVTIILTLYGDGDIITLNDLKYSLFSSSNSENNSDPISFPENPASEPINPSKSLMLIEYGIILLFATVLLTQHFQRKRIVDITTETFTQTEVGIMGVISKLLTLPRKWWLKAKESMFRLYLLPSSICYIVWKTNTLYKIIAELNSIANNSFLQPQLTTLGKLGFYSFFLCSSASNLVLLSALYLTFVSTFYVDLFKFSKVLGVNTLFIYIPSNILVLFYIVSNSFKIKTFGIIILYVLFLNIIVTLILFGRTKNKQTENVKSSFFKVNISRIANENESSDLLISAEENNLSDEQYNDHKQRIINYIISKITPEIQVSVNRFSKLFHVSIELAHKLLTDAYNDVPNLGKYYIEEQIYIRNPDSEIGSTNLDIRSQKKHGEFKASSNINDGSMILEKNKAEMNNSRETSLSSTKSLFSTPVFDTKDGTISPIFNSVLTNLLDINIQTDIHTFIRQIKDYLLSSANQLQKVNEVLFHIIKDDFINALERITILKKNDGVLKERITQYMLYLIASFENKDNLSHPSFEHYIDYFNEKNILCGFGALSSKGFDEINLNMVRTSRGYPRISKLILNEFKYKYSNKPFKISSFRRDFRSLPSVMRKSIQEIFKNNKNDTFASYSLKDGKIISRKNSGFSFGMTPNRGNDLLIKLDGWFSSLDQMRNVRQEILKEKKFGLDEKLETQETLGEAIYTALKAQGELEALIENGFYLSYEGKLVGNQFTVHPKTSRKSKFVVNGQMSPEIEINLNNFSMLDSLNTLEKKKTILVNKQFINITAYTSFNLIEDNIFSLYFKGLNKDRYRIFVTDSVDGFRKDDNYIVVSSNYLDENYQDLCYLIKIRFINDLRDKCLLAEWWREIDNKTIVPIFKNSTNEDFKVYSHFTFISTKVNSDSKGYLFNSSLKRIGKYQYMIGWDIARHFGFLPEKSEMLSSKWFREIDLAFSLGTAHHDNNSFRELDDIFASWEWARRNARVKDAIQIDGKNPSFFFAFQSKNKSIFSFLKKIFDYSYSSWLKSKSSRGNDILNILYPYWLSPRLFTKEQYREFRVLIFEKKGKHRSIFKANSSSVYQSFAIKLHRNCINLFPQIYLTDNNTVRFGITVTKKWVVDLLLHELYTCPFINNSGLELLVKQYKKWNSIVSSDKSPIMYMNPMQACWLLYRSIMKMKQVDLQLFQEFKRQYTAFRNSNQISKAQKMWPWMEIPLTRKAFNERFSFAVMPVGNASMKSTSKTGYLRYRILYETVSEEVNKFVHTVLFRLIDLYEYREMHEWLKSVFDMISTFLEIL